MSFALKIGSKGSLNETMVKCLQINIGKRIAAADEVNLRVSNGEAGIVFLQEPKTTMTRKVRGPYGGTSFHSSRDLNKPIRAAIWIQSDLVKLANCLLLEQFSNRDQTSVLMDIKEPNGAKRKLILCSIYIPALDDNNSPITNPINQILESLVVHCKTTQTELIIAGDFNAHNKIWGDKKDDNRGHKIIDFLNTYDISLINKGSAPTFEVNDKKSVIDLTVSSPCMARLISNWNVDQNDSFSDHKIIRFDIASEKFDPIISRIKKRTNWIRYKILLKQRLENFTINSTSSSRFDHSALLFAEILIQSYSDCCKSKIIKGKFFTDWFGPQLKAMRNKLRKLYKKAKHYGKTNKQYSDILFKNYKQLKNEYKEKCLKTKNAAWRQKMSELDCVKDTSRLLKILENGSTGQIGSLIKTDGTYTSNNKESIDLLMTTHFPECSTVHSESEPEIIFNHNNTNDLEDIENSITIEKIKWAINSLSPFKSPGEDGIFPALLQKAEEIVTPFLQKFFKLSLQFSYIPITWRGTLVKFIPKAGKPRYDSPKAFRPISLMSFILKTLEKLIDFNIRNKVLPTFPLHKFQHAYQPGKGTDTALHSLVSEVEKNILSQGMSLAVFIDIEGAFDNTSFETITKAAKDKGVNKWTLEWINKMLKNRLIKSCSDDDDFYYNPTRGCPQGGCLSPILWCLVVDSLICQLAEKGFFVAAYADDLAILTSAKNKFKNELCKRMKHQGMKIVENWCNETGLSVNPEKSNVMNFSKCHNRKLTIDITLFGKAIKQTDNFKYLGIHLDEKLLWNNHIDKIITKSRRTLWAVKSMVARSWGLNPKRMLWVYQQIILPRITYGCIVWWHSALKECNKNKLESLQRTALLLTSGAMRTTPSISLEAILNVFPLYIKIQSTAFSCYLRLKKSQMWRLDSATLSHKKIENLLDHSFENRDSCPRTVNLDLNFKTTINERKNWSYGLSISNNPHCWFTDGSKTEDKTAVGIHNPALNISISKRTSNHSSILQTELKAIEECADHCIKKNITNKPITIITDSRSALFALNKTNIESTTVLQCINKLRTLAENNAITIAWCPSHSGITGNEKADELAKIGLQKYDIDIDVAVGEQIIENKLSLWGSKTAVKTWNNSKGKLEHSKTCITPFNGKKANSLLNLSRAGMRTIIGLTTGHACTNAYLMLIGKGTNEQCRFCKVPNSRETISHILKNCPMLERARYKHFGVGSPSDISLKNLHHKQLLKFSTDTGVSKIILNPYR